MPRCIYKVQAFSPIYLATSLNQVIFITFFWQTSAIFGHIRLIKVHAKKKLFIKIELNNLIYILMCGLYVD